MSSQSGAAGTSTIIITSILSIIVTLGIVAVLISMYGREEVASEVSPFVESAKEALLPSQNERAEPETEADMIMEAVAQNQAASVLIYTSELENAEFLGRGILVTSNGYIITDAGIIAANTSYSVAVPGTKERFEATVSKVEGALAVLKITHSTTLIGNFSSLTPVENDLVVAITGDEKMRIGTGIVTEATDTMVVTNIFGTITPGSLLAAKSGYAVGIGTSGNQKPDAPAFTLLTKDDISILTATTDSQ